MDAISLAAAVHRSVLEERAAGSSGDLVRARARRRALLTLLEAEAQQTGGKAKKQKPKGRDGKSARTGQEQADFAAKHPRGRGGLWANSSKQKPPPKSRLASKAPLDAKGLKLAKDYLRICRHAQTNKDLDRAYRVALAIYEHVRGPEAKAKIANNLITSDQVDDVLASYVVRAGMPELRANLGSSLVLYNDPLGYYTSGDLLEMMKMSPDVLHRIRATGVTIHVGDRPVTTMNKLGYLADDQARGHPAGERWEDIGGMYNPTENVAVAGRGNAQYGRFEGLIAHELGHAYDQSTGLSASPGFREMHASQVAMSNNPYYMQPDPAGSQEYFAQICNYYWLDGATTVNEQFGPVAAAWAKQNLPR